MSTKKTYNIDKLLTEIKYIKNIDSCKVLAVFLDVTEANLSAWRKRNTQSAMKIIELFHMALPPDARIAVPTESEFRDILACASQHLQRAMLITWYSGLRPGPQELNYARWSAIDFAKKTLTVFSAEKGGLPVRIVPLCQPIIDHLGKWYADDQPKSDDYIILYFGRPVRRMERSWLAAKKRAGITRRLRLYDLRHAFVTTLLERGADLKSVSEIVGHASPDLTMQIYQHVSSDLKRAAVDLLS